jgi:hypothetical protein
MKLSRTLKESGTMLIETLCSATIIIGAMASVFAANSSLLYLIQNGKENLNANQCIQERVEMLRIANWSQITNATYLNTSFAKGTLSSRWLSKSRETITLTAYPDPSVTGKIIVERDGVQHRIVRNDANFTNQESIRYELVINWEATKANKRSRSRTDSAVVTKGGIAK